MMSKAVPNPVPFRITSIDYLNAAPLNYGFKHGICFKGFKDLADFHLIFQTPSACSDSLRDGKVDAGLISSIECLRMPSLKIVPSLCISSPRKVRSVVILFKVPPNSIKALALDASSRSSSVLAQIILREKYGVQPSITEMPPNLETMLKGHDAALMIGDKAMKADRQGLVALDMAEEWYAWTGLPFVFALWAIRPDAPRLDVLGGAAPFFHQSFELGKQNLESIIDQASRDIGWTKQEIREYLTENLSYALGKAEMESLSLFFEKAASLGFAPENKGLEFI
jgi:chorismate dehydratase